MRESKYRAWDGEKMYYATLEDLIDAMGDQCAEDVSLQEQVGEELAGFAGKLLDTATGMYRRRKMVYMEIIGHTDKNDKEIYKDDLLLLRYPIGESLYRVEIGENTQEVDGLAFTYYGVYLVCIRSDVDSLMNDPESGYGFASFGELEVIGNIYETPDLLKEEADENTPVSNME